MQYLYLHGFASSPASHKAQYFAQRFQELNLSLFVPDLNQDDFRHLTLSRQLDQINNWLKASPQPTTIIGSSFGGLTAAWLAESNLQVQNLILLAPAFNLLDYWLPKLPADTLKNWSQNGHLPVYHYGEKQTLLLNYEFVTDLQSYDTQRLQRPIPTLILHGTNDETVPLAASDRYAKSRSWVTLTAFNSDHTLANVLPDLWLQTVCSLNLEGSGPKNGL